jgi:hypothetical protein
MNCRDNISSVLRHVGRGDGDKQLPELAKPTNPQRSVVWSLFGHPIRKLSHRVRSPVTLAGRSSAGPRHRRCSLDRERIIQEAAGLHGVAVGTGRPGRPRTQIRILSQMDPSSAWAALLLLPREVWQLTAHLPRTETWRADVLDT